MGRIDSVHEELRLSEYENELREISGLWRTLTALRTKASQNQSFVEQYRTLLLRSIERINQQRADATVDQEAIAREYHDWYALERARLGIAERERYRLPASMESWVEKWHPQIWQRHWEAFVAFCEAPTKSKLAALKESAIAVMVAFCAE